MKKIELNHPQAVGIQKAYESTLNYLAKTEEASGGCHLISAMLHILLTEQGIENELVIGEVEDYEANTQFSHSWVEINGEIFDPAIMHTLDGNVHSPVYNGVKLTLEPLTMEYGVSKDKDALDRDAKQLLDKSVTAYLDAIKDYGYPKNYLWDEILKAGIGIMGFTNISRLRKKYDTHYRVLKTKGIESEGDL
ncbi:lasso peptide biosynthesis protein [Cytobacillus gottheilii]|uniref:lasso peptide biosynthesis protein n=1 Tax=Cytobacillus gottheilii TaxID=859144 RepID=UPI001C59DE01|nr:lasso peptide biosynthesis protein [Cytobacillus gottheilii]